MHILKNFRKLSLFLQCFLTKAFRAFLSIQVSIILNLKADTCWQKANKPFPQHSHSKAGHALLIQLWLIPLQTFPSFTCLQLHGIEAYDPILISSCPVSSLSWVVHHKACIRCLWWSWPRLRRVHDLKLWVSEGNQQGSFNAFAVCQNLLLPPRSKPMRRQNVGITIYSVQPIFYSGLFQTENLQKIHRSR